MLAFVVNMKHSPESCPMFNDAVRKKFKEAVSKREEVAKKHGVKVLSGITSMPDHLIFFVVEAPSQIAVEDCFREMGFAFWNNVEIRQVRFAEDAFKML